MAANGRPWFVVWRSAEHSPLNRAISESVHRHLGVEAEKISLAPFSLGDGDALRRLFADAGFRDVEIETARIIRKFLPPEVSIPGLLTSLPIGTQIAALSRPCAWQWWQRLAKRWPVIAPKRDFPFPRERICHRKKMRATN
ncbi:MAG: hypothetical protein VCE75_22575 [Alphaproteobacteria bacterium]